MQEKGCAGAVRLAAPFSECPAFRALAGTGAFGVRWQGWVGGACRDLLPGL